MVASTEARIDALYKEIARLNAEIKRLLPFEKSHNELIEQLQKLGEDFDCPPGMNRIAWLRERLQGRSTIRVLNDPPPKP